MKRRTNEVDITVILGVDETRIDTGDGILDHLLRTMFFYLEVKADIVATWDLRHHLWEDMGIAIGQELSPPRDRLARFGNSTIPMDDALVMVSLDISRPYLKFDLRYNDNEGFDLSLVKEFYWALARTMGITLHINQISGENSHHIVEASFKAFGNALWQALQSSEKLKSTKGALR